MSTGSVADTLTAASVAFDNGRSKSKMLVEEYKGWLLVAFANIRKDFFA